MGKRTTCIALVGSLLAIGALFGATEARAVKLVANSVAGAPGTQVSFTVSLLTEGANVAGTQNDLSFDATHSPIPRRCNKAANVQITCSADTDCPAVAGVADTCSTKPACYVNADINKGGTSFAYRGATGCTGPACGGIRALVLATDNVDLIPNGSVLYTCKVNIAAGSSGSFPLGMTGVIASDAAGTKITGASGTDGSIVAASGPTPTTGGGATPTPTSTTGGGATPTPTTGTVACNPPAIQFDTVNATPGTQVTISAKLLSGTAAVAGTQNDFTFDATNIPIPRRCNKAANAQITCSADTDCPTGDTCSTKPACYVNADINKGGTSFAYRGATGCTGPACGGIRALVLATDNVDVIPNGSVLFTCKVNVAAGANTTYTIGASGVILSDAAGVKITGPSGCAGAVVAGSVIPPSATPTNTGVPPPTSTATTRVSPTNTATVRQTVLATVTATATKGQPTATAGTSGTPFVDEDGCQIGITGSSSAAWLLLIPAVGLLVMRRRSR